MQLLGPNGVVFATFATQILQKCGRLRLLLSAEMIAAFAEQGLSCATNYQSSKSKAWEAEVDLPISLPLRKSLPKRMRLVKCTCLAVRTRCLIAE